MALAAIEAPLVPHAVLRDHLLGGVHRVTAARAAVSVVSLLADLGLSVDAAEEESNVIVRVKDQADGYFAGQSG